jgi:hypothetical protein
MAALARCNNNRTHAARLLDISVRTLRNKLNEYRAATAAAAVAEQEVDSWLSREGRGLGGPTMGV